MDGCFLKKRRGHWRNKSEVDPIIQGLWPNIQNKSSLNKNQKFTNYKSKKQKCRKRKSRKPKSRKPKSRKPKSRKPKSRTSKSRTSFNLPLIFKISLNKINLVYGKLIGIDMHLTMETKTNLCLSWWMKLKSEIPMQVEIKAEQHLWADNSIKD